MDNNSCPVFPPTAFVWDKDGAVVYSAAWVKKEVGLVGMLLVWKVMWSVQICVGL